MFHKPSIGVSRAAGVTLDRGDASPCVASRCGSTPRLHGERVRSLHGADTRIFDGAVARPDVQGAVA